MKKTLTIVFILIIQIAQSQVPQTINYQAIARRYDGTAIANKQITIEVSILQGNNCTTNPSTCNLVWQEIHTPTTNNYGIFNISIGAGQKTFAGSAASFADINWADLNNGYYYLQIRADFGDSPNINSLVDLGTILLQSVPYALASQSALSLARLNSKIDAYLFELMDVTINAPQNNDVLSWNGTKWTNATTPRTLTELNDVTVTAPANNHFLGFNGTNWINKQVSLSEIQGLSITNPQNFQTLTYNGTTWTNAFLSWIENNNYLYTIVNKPIGVFTSTPSTAFHIALPNSGTLSTSTFSVTGTFVTNSTFDIAGAGTRMFFAPSKGVFRAGTVDATQWNAANSGEYSVAFGYNTIASGNYSFASGQTISSTGQYSVGFGQNNTCSGAYSLGMGLNNDVSGAFASAFGNGLKANAYGVMVIGRFNKDNPAYNPNVWTATDPIFIIGNGTSTSARNNALIIRKNGDILTEGTITQSSPNPGKNFSNVKLNNLLKITPVFFEEKNTYGFNPVEIKTYYPELIIEPEPSNYYINYTGFVPLLLGQIKEQQNTIDSLKNQNANLEKKLEELEARLRLLESKVH